LLARKCETAVTSRVYGGLTIQELLQVTCSFKMTASDVTSFETSFFRLAGTSEAETSVSGNAEFLIATGEEKK